MLAVLKEWSKAQIRVAVSYGNLDRYGEIMAVDELGIVLHTSQGDVCLLWHAVKQVRPAPE